MHRAGVMHRDISPANVVIAQDGAPWLVDFALATPFAEIRPEFTHHSEIVATPAYIAPEQTGRTPGLDQLRAEVTRVTEGMTTAVRELRELSRGIHPSVLTEGGLSPALKALARHSTVPVELDVGVEQRLPPPVEVAAYYTVSEALTNAAKHADAASASVSVRAQGSNRRARRRAPDRQPAGTRHRHGGADSHRRVRRHRSPPPRISRAPRPRVTKLNTHRMSTSTRFWKPIRE
jgi:Protein kinase domain